MSLPFTLQTAPEPSSNDITVELDGTPVTIHGKYCYADTLQLAQTLEALYQQEELNPADLVDDIKANHNANELREEQLYFAQGLIRNIKRKLETTGSHSYKETLVEAVKYIKAEIEQSSFEG